MRQQGDISSRHDSRGAAVLGVSAGRGRLQESRNRTRQIQGARVAGMSE
jgi:hypothetical protein